MEGGLLRPVKKSRLYTPPEKREAGASFGVVTHRLGGQGSGASARKAVLCSGECWGWACCRGPAGLEWPASG